MQPAQSPLPSARFSLKRIETCKTPAAVARIINHRQLPVVIVHPFYAEYKRPLVYLQPSYCEYKRNSISLMAGFSGQTWKRTAILAESLQAVERAAAIFNENGISTKGVSYFLSLYGELPNPKTQSVFRETQIKFNLLHKDFEKITSLVKHGTVFSLGLYDGLCLKTAMEELSEIAFNNGIGELKIAINGMFCVKSEDIRISN